VLRPIIIALGTLVGGVAIYAAVIYLFHLAPTEPGKTIGFVCSFAVAATACILATRRMGASVKAERRSIEELEREGVIVRESYEAARAFQVEEFEDEGCQYYLELKDGRVLYLCGQYLYDHEPIEDQARKFPCTQFTLLRDKRHGWIVDVLCVGTVLEPEAEAPPSLTRDFGSDEAPGDGDIITDRSYEEIKRELVKG
jgi:hypothetical protein